MGEQVSAAITPAFAANQPQASTNPNAAGKSGASSCSSVTDEDEEMEEEGVENDGDQTHTENSQVGDQDEEPADDDEQDLEVKQKRKYKSRKYMKKQLICGHDEKPYHAKGLCKNCYQRELERRKFEKTGHKRKNKPIVYKCPNVVGQAYKNKMCKECCYA